MTVTIQNRHDTAEIDHLFVTQSKFAPGDTVRVGVVLKPYKQPLYTQMISVKIPLSTPDGTLPLSIQGGADSDGGGMSLLAALLGGGAPVQTTGPAANVAELVKQFVEKPQNNQITAHLTLPTSAVTIRGEKLSGLPPTFSTIMQSPRTTGFHSVRDEVKTAQTVPYVVSGSQTLNIQVQRKDISDTSRPAPSSSTSSPSSSASSGPPSSTVPLSADDSDSMAFQTLTLPSDTTAKASATKQTSTAEAGTSVSTTTTTVTTDTYTAATDSADAAVKPVGRLPSVWRQTSQADFAAGTLTNVAVSSLGDVRLAPSLAKIADTTENYIWAIQPDGKGNTYLATGDSGVIYKRDAAGKLSPFFKTGELEATALCLDDSGNVYAGTAPNGIVFRITPNGKGSKVFTAKEKYITALAQSNNYVYVATGGGTGRVYRLSEDSSGGLVNPRFVNSSSKPYVPTYDNDVLFSSPQAHILSLTTDKAGNIYAGSAPDGIVYKIVQSQGPMVSNDGGLPQIHPEITVFYDAAEPNITALATDSLGNVYAGTAPTGNVYRIGADDAAKRLTGLTSAGVTSLKTDGSDAVYVSAGSTISKISPDNSVQSYGMSDDQQFISLALDPATQAVYAGTGTVGSLYQIGATGSDPETGTFVSAVHDAGRRAQWGTLTWRTDTLDPSAVTLETRSGDVARPDASWSAWSAPLTQSTGETVTSPPARYLQYQAHFTETNATPLPKLSGVSVYYLPRNQPPTVSLSKPAAGDAVSKTADLHWNGSDPDKDTLSYDISYSSDGGSTWKPILASVKAATPKAKTTVTNIDTEALKNAPASVQALVKAQIAANATASDSAGKSAQNLKETTYSWDTTQVPDGFYQIKVTATDKPSNPVGALTAKAVSTPFLIANTAPTLTLRTPTVNADKSVTLTGTAQTGLAFVQAVQAKVDDGDPIAASADDGLFDSVHEPFTLTAPSLSSGPHKIEVQALDQAGNKATQTVTVTVP